MKNVLIIRSYVPRPIIDESKIADAAKLINAAKKPYIMVGQGVILGNAEEEFKAFVEKSGIPSCLDNTWVLVPCRPIIRLNVGMLGMHGNYGANIKTNECDVLIAIGMRFDDRVTGDLKRFAKQAKVIHLRLTLPKLIKMLKPTLLF